MSSIASTHVFDSLRKIRAAPGLHVSDEEVVAVLKPVQLLHPHGLFVDPLEAGEIAVSRIVRGLQPASLAMQR